MAEEKIGEVEKAATWGWWRGRLPRVGRARGGGLRFEGGVRRFEKKIKQLWLCRLVPLISGRTSPYFSPIRTPFPPPAFNHQPLLFEVRSCCWCPAYIMCNNVCIEQKDENNPNMRSLIRPLCSQEKRGNIPTAELLSIQWGTSGIRLLLN